MNNNPQFEFDEEWKDGWAAFTTDGGLNFALSVDKLEAENHPLVKPLTTHAVQMRIVDGKMEVRFKTDIGGEEFQKHLKGMSEKNPKLKLIAETSLYEDDQWILCPLCRDEYVHFSKPRFIEGLDYYKAHPNVRGSCIEIDCYCENGGHKFKIIIGFHKGYTRTWCEQLPRNHKVEDVR